jgi:hypothetical protein
VENERASIKTENAEIVPQQVLVLCSERWRALDLEGKKPWDGRSREECATQSRLIDEYRASQAAAPAEQ